MRILLLLLVLANLGFFVWDRFLRAPVSAEARIQQVQMAPEKIRIVTAPAAPAAKPAVAPAPAPPAAAAKLEEKAPCLAWGVFVGPQDAARADALMAEAKLPPGQVRRVLSDVDGHWVVIPPQKAQGDIGKVVDNLKKQGVTEYLVVTEPPQWRNAISLGMFRTAEAAQSLLAELRTKGVADAVVERRERFFQQMVYLVREPDDTVVARLTALRLRLPGSEIKAVACPAA